VQRPWDDDSAGFSGAFVIAATLMHGRFTLVELTHESCTPGIKALMEKIRQCRPRS